jgi:hypothetical protein
VGNVLPAAGLFPPTPVFFLPETTLHRYDPQLPDCRLPEPAAEQSVFGLNIIGLAFGLVSSLLIMLWVQDEWNYDRFHAHADKLYR